MTYGELTSTRTFLSALTCSTCPRLSISLFLSFFMAWISPVAFSLTIRTSPKAPRPIIARGSKSSAQCRWRISLAYSVSFLPNSFILSSLTCRRAQRRTKKKHVTTVVWSAKVFPVQGGGPVPLPGRKRVEGCSQTLRTLGLGLGGGSGDRVHVYEVSRPPFPKTTTTGKPFCFLSLSQYIYIIDIAGSPGWEGWCSASVLVREGSSSSSGPARPGPGTCTSPRCTSSQRSPAAGSRRSLSWPPSSPVSSPELRRCIRVPSRTLFLTRFCGGKFPRWGSQPPSRGSQKT